MKPLFEVGEEVILWPPRTKYQGFETTITDIDATDSEWQDGDKCVGYCIYPNPIQGRETYIGGRMVKEEWIRKKPKGNGKTLTEFMDSLKDLTVTV